MPTEIYTGPRFSEAGVAEARRVAADVGYPVVVKAVAGGGGIGMQVVADPGLLERALRSCSDRGKAAFADARVYMERYVDRPRQRSHSPGDRLLRRH